MSLLLRPVRQKEAFAFINAHHRHHISPQWWLWGHAATLEGELVGVAVVGRPVARALDDGVTMEVTRLCTTGVRNACSILYAAARRAALAMGYKRGLTYILESETGSSLLASGWRMDRVTKGDTWDRPNRNRGDQQPTGPKRRFIWGDWE